MIELNAFNCAWDIVSAPEMSVIRTISLPPSPPPISWLDLGQGGGLRKDTWFRNEAAVGKWGELVESR